jgi:hypothetical protein
VTSILEEALKEVGYTESPVNRTKYAAEAGHLDGQPWCATFVVAMARRANVHLPNESAYTPTMAQGFKTAGLWSKEPQSGSLAFFNFPDATTRIQHVGIVVSANPAKQTVTCVEGNTSAGRLGNQVNGGGVWLRTRPLAYVVGFGHLALPTPPQQSTGSVLLWL